MGGLPRDAPLRGGPRGHRGRVESRAARRDRSAVYRSGLRLDVAILQRPFGAGSPMRCTRSNRSADSRVHYRRCPWPARRSESISARRTPSSHSPPGECRPRVLVGPDANPLIPSIVSFHPNGHTLVEAPRPALAARSIRPTPCSRSSGSWGGRSTAKRCAAPSRASRSSCARAPTPPFWSTRARAISRYRRSPRSSCARFARSRKGRWARPSIARSSRCRQTSTSCSGRLPSSPGRSRDLDVIRILNEPTAAALAYGYGRGTRERIAIYDFGGGTFDVTLLELSGNVFEVLATAGDTFLGGDDIDILLADNLADALLSTHKIDARQDRRAFELLRGAAEQAKIDLSSMDVATIRIADMGYAPGGRALRSSRPASTPPRSRATRGAVDQSNVRCVQRSPQACEHAWHRLPDGHPGGRLFAHSRGAQPGSRVLRPRTAHHVAAGASGGHGRRHSRRSALRDAEELGRRGRPEPKRRARTQTLQPVVPPGSPIPPAGTQGPGGHHSQRTRGCVVCAHHDRGRRRHALSAPSRERIQQANDHEPRRASRASGRSTRRCPRAAARRGTNPRPIDALDEPESSSTLRDPRDRPRSIPKCSMKSRRARFPRQVPTPQGDPTMPPTAWAPSLCGLNLRRRRSPLRRPTWSRRSRRR